MGLHALLVNGNGRLPHQVEQHSWDCSRVTTWKVGMSAKRKKADDRHPIGEVGDRRDGGSRLSVTPREASGEAGGGAGENLETVRTAPRMIIEGIGFLGESGAPAALGRLLTVSDSGWPKHAVDSDNRERINGTSIL